jgi:hypothetical protein
MKIADTVQYLAERSPGSPKNAVVTKVLKSDYKDDDWLGVLIMIPDLEVVTVDRPPPSGS